MHNNCSANCCVCRRASQSRHCQLLLQLYVLLPLLLPLLLLTLPLSSTTMLCALRTVDSRCAMTSTVRAWLPSVGCMARSRACTHPPRSSKHSAFAEMHHKRCTTQALYLTLLH
jgi:hypothetical protein